MFEKRFVERIHIRNLLSFGPDSEPFELRPLNVLIGPNASGKSNLLDVFGLLKSLPTKSKLAETLRQGGGIGEWLWKGGSGPVSAVIETVLQLPSNARPLRYRLSFTNREQFLEITDEALENATAQPGYSEPFFYYRFQHGHPVLNVRTASDEPLASNVGRAERKLRPEDISDLDSVLAQRKDPDQYPELTYLNDQFDRIGLYRQWSLGRDSQPRLPQPGDLPSNELLEGARNLGQVLNEFDHIGAVRNKLIDRLRDAYEEVERISTRFQGGTIQIFLHERGLADPIPATRLSDGTIRLLFLLALLLNPNPPPIICLEEPEIGLHPDLMPTIAELLMEASTRTQLIVTTHSVGLVSALGETPDSIVVCERSSGGTEFRRLQKEKLVEWLEDYELGELWRKGEIGGTRW